MTRLLPIREATDVVSIDIEVDGEPLPRSIAVRHVDVLREVNRIPHARLKIADGDAALADFAASAADYFVPGRQVTLRAGYHGALTPIFAGIIVKQRISVRDHTSWLEVECRDAATKMTLSPRHRYFEEVTDSELIADLLTDYDLKADLADTTATHAQLLQYQATDWDFMLARLDANGQFCAVEDGTVRSFVPEIDSERAAEVRFGTNLFELDAEFDARHQVGSVTAVAWDPAQQSLQEIEAADPGWTSNGDLGADQLVAATNRDSQQLWHGGALAGDALQAWADGTLRRSRVAGSCGRARVQGVAALKLGETVGLAGVGARFNGGVLVTGVRHIFTDNDWSTDISFGAAPTLHAERFDISALPASGISPAVAGLQAGIVSAIHDDPAGEFRIRVKLPIANPDSDGVWARLATIDAGNKRGTYFRPEVDDEVVVGFFHDDPSFPVILGMLHSSARRSPEAPAKANNLKGYTSRGGLKLTFDDDSKAITLSTPDGASVVLSDGDGAIKLSDKHGNELSMTADGIKVSSKGKISLAAKGDLALEGTNAAIKGSAQLKADGCSSAALSSSGILEVSGTLVKIN